MTSIIYKTYASKTKNKKLLKHLQQFLLVENLPKEDFKEGTALFCSGPTEDDKRLFLLLFYYHRSTTGTTMQVNNKLNTIVKKKTLKGMLIQETKISNHNITAFFFPTSKTKNFYNILSDIHG